MYAHDLLAHLKICILCNVYIFLQVSQLIVEGWIYQEGEGREKGQDRHI